MNLVEAIWLLYPSARLEIDVWVEDDGTGPKVTYWDTQSLGPVPTQATLDAQAVPVARKLKRGELLLAFKADYALVWMIVTYLRNSSRTAAEINALSWTSTP